MKDFLKEDGFSEAEKTKFRDDMIAEICKRKGWDRNKLTVEQLFEMQQELDGKTPGLICS